MLKNMRAFMAIEARLIHGDCTEELKKIEENSIDLIVTSPPYADQRKNSYGGINPDRYVDWFLPISEELLRVLKPTGSFILNIKEKVVNGERHTYVIELILEMRKQGWYGQKSLFGIKRILTRVNGRIDSEIPGRDSFNLIKIRNLKCFRKQ